MAYQEHIAEVLARFFEQQEMETGLDVATLTGLVEVPRDKSMGDYAFPCFRLAKVFRKAPPMIASEIEGPLKQALNEDAMLADVVAVGPYLNFRVNKAELAAELLPAILDGSYLARREAQNQRVMVEYSQPNTHKAFHVGHTRNVALGDALWRILNWNGYDTIPVNYIGDEGTHIAKCLWYYQNYFEGEVPDTNLGEFLGELYTNATMLLDFKLLSQCPMPNVVTARVTKIEPIEGQKQNKAVTLDTAEGPAQVICGGTKYNEGDIVAYAQPGARVAGRTIGKVEKYGITSVGMICSDAELELGEDKMKIYTFSPGTPIGEELAELFRIKNALPEDQKVLDVMRARSEGVASTLHALEAKEGELFDLWQKTKQWSMDEFHKIYDWLGAQFDHYFYESEVGDRGKQIVLDYLEKGTFVRSEGAVGADLSDANLPFFLLLKSDGSGLYATKDLALAKDKFEKFKVDHSIYVVDMSQSLHFQQVFKTLEMMGYEKAKDCYHLAYGLVVLPEGKMSSRAGNIILFSQLKERLDSKIKEEFLEKYRGDWSDAEIDEAARRIAVATIRYGMLNQDNIKNIVFDLDEWTARSGNTGPYLLYAYARTRSIMRELGDFDTSIADWSALNHESEQDLLNRMSKFHEMMERAGREHRPYVVCQYLYALCRDFSRFFGACSVLHAETPELKAARAQLVDGFGRLLQQGLANLGIQTLERM